MADDFDRYMGPQHRDGVETMPVSAGQAQLNPLPAIGEWMNVSTLQEHEVLGAGLGALGGVLLVRHLQGQRLVNADMFQAGQLQGAELIGAGLGALAGVLLARKLRLDF
jgi:hypothetical protein